MLTGLAVATFLELLVARSVVLRNEFVLELALTLDALDDLDDDGNDDTPLAVLFTVMLALSSIHNQQN